jgi:hypothetical protein
MYLGEWRFFLPGSIECMELMDDRSGEATSFPVETCSLTLIKSRGYGQKPSLIVHGLLKDRLN